MVGQTFMSTRLYYLSDVIDFTKQYNRLKQQHYVQNPQAGPSSSRLDRARPSLAPNLAPLPARNRNNSKVQGIALNPKAILRSSKDKSDRATQEQVLDPRTRLVLSGLVNRGIVGEIQRCISTGKEVGPRRLGCANLTVTKPYRPTCTMPKGQITLQRR